ncbi:MAG: hypothetical protein ABSD71_14575, partial [Bacteroidales bacterium]
MLRITLPILSRDQLGVILLPSLLILILLSLSMNGFTQDSIVEKKPSKVMFNGYIKDMQTIMIHNIDQDWIISNLIHNR